MRMLCGLMHPTEGKAIVAGHDVSLEHDSVKDHIGYMAQRFGLYSDLTVSENMIFYSDLFGVTGRERDDLTAMLLRMTRLEPFQKRPAGKLSGGMKQKLALMCTLLHKPLYFVPGQADERSRSRFAPRFLEPFSMIWSARG